MPVMSFIWNSWWRNKERFILLLVGVLIVSTGLSYLIGTTQANNGTVVDELQKRWNSSYDIVVRPPGSRSVTEDLHLLEPNYMSGLDGGITMKQYQTIKDITDVEVAAPIAMIGNNSTGSSVGTHTFDDPGVYKLTITDYQNTGLQVDKSTTVRYLAAGWDASGDTKQSGVSPVGLGKQPLDEYGSDTMIAGIDPEAEARLVGLDQATKKSDHSRYFTDEDVVTALENVDMIPVLMNERDYIDASRTYKYEKLDLPLIDDSMVPTIQEVTKKGGKTYLDKLPTVDEKPQTYKITTAQVQKQFIHDILNNSLPEKYSGYSEWLILKPSPITYQSVKSPYPSRWPFTYQVEPKLINPDSLLAKRSMYRAAREFGTSSDDWPRINPYYIGVFDPKKLNLSKDPLTELPMETYFPAKAQWVMDKNETPVNPPRDVKPTNDPYDFMTKPPSMLTTLDAAFKIRGKKAISVIRVNVKGIDTMNEQSEKKLQAVAQEIEDKTGLITDVTLGSSPQLALTYLPGLKDQPALGWVQQPWIKLGSSMAIFQEAKVGMSGVIASVILVALVYVFSSNIILLYARKKEFAILLATRLAAAPAIENAVPRSNVTRVSRRLDCLDDSRDVLADDGPSDRPCPDRPDWSRRTVDLLGRHVRPDAVDPEDSTVRKHPGGRSLARATFRPFAVRPRHERQSIGDVLATDITVACRDRLTDQFVHLLPVRHVPAQGRFVCVLARRIRCP